METAAPTIRALELENQRLRADVAELVESLLTAQTMAIAGRSFPINDPRWAKIADALAKHGA